MGKPRTKQVIVVAAKQKNPGGRPSAYNKDLAEDICKMISEGKTLTSIVRMPGMPHYSTVMRWLVSESEFQEEFRDMYTRARDAQADYWADEIIDEADLAVTIPEVNAARLRVDARKWIASKLKPRKYGDKVYQEVENVSKYIPTEVHVRWADEDDQAPNSPSHAPQNPTTKTDS